MSTFRWRFAELNDEGVGEQEGVWERAKENLSRFCVFFFPFSLVFFSVQSNLVPPFCRQRAPQLKSPRILRGKLNSCAKGGIRSEGNPKKLSSAQLSLMFGVEINRQRKKEF